ncbi:tetratricopeptide repeat protein, partial [Allorhizocola rhizosphaerae]|uniref:tetratricopeptide repeat protein n=1 Tax=Allorhizocola rhizosphaerae TaxID=1872709 RepID=UPI0013C353BA
RRLSGVLATAHIELDVLDPPEAAELLTHLVGTERASAEPAERDSVVAACGRLPLAIRVAAGRVILRPDLTLGRLAERLRGDRVLDELTGDLSSDQGVRASAEQSYRLLSPDEARGYRLLGALGTADCPAWVFDALAGPSTADRMIDGLVDAHLVRLIPGDGAAAPLVRTHHLLRSHAEEHARAHPETARDVAAVLAGWIDTSLQCARGLPFRYFGVRLPASTGRAYGGDGWFDAMRDHLVPMLRVAVERGLTEQAWVLAAAWASYFDLRGEYALWEQAHQTVLPALEQPGHEAGRAVLLRELGQVALYRDDLDLAEQRLCASVDLFGSIGHRDGEGVARIGLGTLCRVRNLDDQAIEHYSTALEAFVATGNREGEAVARNATALIMLRRGQLDEAQRWLAEAFQLAVETDDEHRQAQVRRRIAILCRANGDLAAGQKELEEALRIFQALCDHHCAAYARIALGELCLEAGDHARAHQLFVDSLSIGRELGDITSQAEAYQGLGEVGLTAGRRQTAQRYFAQAVRSWQLASNPAAAARAQARLDEL